MMHTEPIQSPSANAGFFERLAARATYWTGTTNAFILSLMLIVLWVVVGPHFHFSDSWLLVVNTWTSIITFLMVFLIQRSHNRERLGLKIQLGELIASLHDANNRGDRSRPSFRTAVGAPA